MTSDNSSYALLLMIYRRALERNKRYGIACTRHPLRRKASFYKIDLVGANPAVKENLQVLIDKGYLVDGGTDGVRSRRYILTFKGIELAKSLHSLNKI